MENEKENVTSDIVENVLAEDIALHEITSNLPVGICKVIVDDNFTLLHGNKYFHELYGYTRQEMREELNNEVARTVFAEDVPIVRERLKKAMDAGEIFNNEHRVVKKDGTMSWVLVRGSFAKEGGRDIIYCVAIDIGERKFYEQELRINEERFRLALAQTDSTIFDYDIENRLMTHANKSGSMYGIQSITENVPDSLVENETIHPNSVDEFLNMYAKIRAGEKSASCEIKTRLLGGRYMWRKISMTNIYDNDGKAVRAIGMLEDIHEQKERETRLRNKSERDPLTGIFNRRATEKSIQNLLEVAKENTVGAMCIFDIDDFKGINDSYGHLFGDKVLMYSASRIKRIFDGSAILGRVGGDEFLVFIKNAGSEAQCEASAQLICDAFQSEFEHSGIILKATCSVGVAVFPQDGKTFEQLYKKADEALYRAKKAGRNRAIRYK